MNLPRIAEHRAHPSGVADVPVADLSHGLPALFRHNGLLLVRRVRVVQMLQEPLLHRFDVRPCRPARFLLRRLLQRRFVALAAYLYQMAVSTAWPWSAPSHHRDLYNAVVALREALAETIEDGAYDDVLVGRRHTAFELRRDTLRDLLEIGLVPIDQRAHLGTSRRGALPSIRFRRPPKATWCLRVSRQASWAASCFCRRAMGPPAGQGIR